MLNGSAQVVTWFGENAGLVLKGSLMVWLRGEGRDKFRVTPSPSRDPVATTSAEGVGLE